MNLFKFFETMFCGECRAEIAELEEEKQILIRNYQNLMMEKLRLVLDCGKDTLELHNRIQELEAIIDQLEEDNLESFNWPLIEDYEETMYDVSGVSDFYDVEFVRADLKYNLFTKSDWVKILSVVHPLVKEALVRWEKDISDCDNWSSVMSAFVSIAFKKSGYLVQGAFAIAHTTIDEPSRHAYNLFVDTDHRVWLYEPQNNRLMGEMKDGDEVYRTGYVWFLN